MRSALITLLTVGNFAAQLQLGEAAYGSSCNYTAKATKSGWKDIQNLVSFGDSYTDESRLTYFGEHRQAPPVGWKAPASNNTFSGGKSWARIAAESSGVELYNYAVSGAACSNNLTPRIWKDIMQLFPSVAEYEVPAFLADHTSAKTGRIDLNPATTAYSIWVGTNDLAGNAFLSDAHLPGKTVTDYTDCVFAQIKSLYDNAGARYFILQNNVPLDFSPLYNSGTDGRHVYIPDSRFYPTKSKEFAGNGTKVEEKIKMMVKTTNDIFKYRAMATILTEELPGATIALFDSHSLITDIYNSPAEYLTGPPPLNVTGMVVHCPEPNFNGCYNYRHEDRNSFLWYDELHPSEATMRIVAREVTKLLQGRDSPYVTVL
ncbi:GDSL lipase/acylhydrolase family protein [Tirmania nivea]|nr:GDSL lipase/acylhydrolase family protein [Tirmania nivea]